MWLFGHAQTIECAFCKRRYKLVLERYPKSVQLLRSYGKFLEGVKNDPWAAERYFGEADKQVGGLAVGWLHAARVRFSVQGFY